MTVVEAIEMVLSQSQEGMTIQEIYQQICAQDLYQFKAKNPAALSRVGFSHVQLHKALSNCTGKAREDHLQADGWKQTGGKADGSKAGQGKTARSSETLCVCRPLGEGKGPLRRRFIR